MSSKDALDPIQPLLPHRPAEIHQCVDRFLTVMCNSSRRYILELLASPQAKADRLIERRSGEIAQLIGLSAATTSEHLSNLSSLGLVSSRREGTRVYYRIADHLVARSFHELLIALDLYCASLHAPNSSEHAREQLWGKEGS